MVKKKSMSLLHQGINYKLKIAFWLMSVLPLCVTIYLVSNFMLPKTGPRIDILAVVVLSIFISLFGFFVLKEIFRRITWVVKEAKLIAGGDINHTIEVKYIDEVDELGHSLNFLTNRIRSSMQELKSYGERTKEIDQDIQRHVIVLSGLLQISSLISQSAKIDDVIKIAIEKARLLANSDLSFLFLWDDANKNLYFKAADGTNSDYLAKVRLDSRDETIAKMLTSGKPVLLEKKRPLLERINDYFPEEFKLLNTLLVPVHLKNKLKAILGIGNIKEDLFHKKGDLDLIDIFAKQIAIGIENDILSSRIEALETRDLLTGLYNENFMYGRLQEEIKRAIVYQRPCSLVIFHIDRFNAFHKRFGLLNSEAALKKVGLVIKNLVSEIDRVGRTSDDEFAIILPEKNKRQALNLAESIRKEVEFAFSEEEEQDKRITLSGGLSENPLDGIGAEELFVKARELVELSKRQGRNRILISKEKI